MGQIHVHEFISLDGVFEDPAWTFEHGFDPAMGETLGGIMADVRGILLGRTTFEMFAPAWRDRTAQDDPGAPFFNETTKYVVGASEPSQAWSPTERLGAYDAGTIRRLRDDLDGDLYVSGSGRLVRGLLADGLVDQLHLFVYPVALGAGGRLFREGESHRLSLVGHDVYDNGVVHLAYAQA